MLTSEYLFNLAIEHDDAELTKIASEIQFTSNDVEFDKEAGIPSALWAGTKALLGNKTIKSIAIGSGIGAVGGAANAEDGKRMSGALKGGLIGGVAGGAFGAGRNINTSMKAGASFGNAVKAEKAYIGSGFTKAKSAFGKNMAAGKAPIVPPPVAPAPKAAPAPAVAPTAVAPAPVVPAPVAPKVAVPKTQPKPMVDRNPMNQKLSPEQLKSPEMINLPPNMRQGATYSSAQKLGVDPESLTSQGQNVHQMRSLANTSNPVQYNSAHIPVAEAAKPKGLIRGFLDRFSSSQPKQLMR